MFFNETVFSESRSTVTFELDELVTVLFACREREAVEKQVARIRPKDAPGERRVSV